MRRAYYSRPRRQAHEKDMGSYELHAWRDAIAIADALREFASENGIRLADVRRTFEARPVAEIAQSEEKHAELIANYIQRTEGQRPAYLRKISKAADHESQQLFLVLCILGALRAKSVLELRDDFRMELAPGRGNRVTIAGAYSFASQVEQLFVYDWPHEVFDAVGSGDDDDDD